MRFERLDLGAVALGHPPGEGLAGADIAGVALDQGGGVGDGGVARLAGLGRPVPREGAGLRCTGLVAGRQRLRQPDPGGGDAAGGDPGIGDDGAVAGGGEARPARRVARVAVGVDVHRGADLTPLQRPVAVGVVAGVAERQVAGGALVRGRRRRVLADRQHRGREHGRLREPVSDRTNREGGPVAAVEGGRVEGAVRNRSNK